MTRKKRTVFIVLAVLTVVFIWGNSLMPAEISAAFSNWAKDSVNSVLSKFNILSNKDYSLSSDGLLRKIAHCTEFAFLGIFVIQIFEKKRKNIPIVILIGIITALTDETIQLFVQGRGSSVRDVWIDMLGFSLGLGLVFIFKIFKERRKGKNKNE